MVQRPRYCVPGTASPVPHLRYNVSDKAYLPAISGTPHLRRSWTSSLYNRAMNSFFSAIRSHRALQALHFREFRLVCGSQVFGNIGMWMDELSRGWLIYQLTDSVVQLGLVRGIQLVPTLLTSPFAGTAADRYSRKSLLLVSQTLHGLA